MNFNFKFDVENIPVTFKSIKAIFPYETVEAHQICPRCPTINHYGMPYID